MRPTSPTAAATRAASSGPQTAAGAMKAEAERLFAVREFAAAADAYAEAARLRQAQVVQQVRPPSAAARRPPPAAGNARREWLA